MTAHTTQISAHVSKDTKERLDAFARARGIRKGHLIEQALLHHMTALEEIPAGFIIPPRVVLKADAFAELVSDLEADDAPTQALSKLFHGD